MEAHHTLLVVDDDMDIRDALQDALELEGYAVQLAADGLEALERLRSSEPRPQLILLDLMMPRMDGVAFREALRHERAWPARTWTCATRWMAWAWPATCASPWTCPRCSPP